MERPLLSASAFAVACHIYNPDELETAQDDLMLGIQLNIPYRTIRAAVRELGEVGAITYDRRRRGRRTITVQESSWVWAAVREARAKQVSR